jgi:hypothetical protein
MPEPATLSFQTDPGSFRDPSGFIFRYNNEVLRAIAPSFFTHYNHLHDSGLYASLVSGNKLITHSDDANCLGPGFAGYKVIKPETIPFISYPYEWCFSGLKDAALLTLDIQLESLKHGMVLKDASAFNVQFLKGKPIFIDTLSFEKYREGMPWVAYRQFCQHFLAPLALIAYKGEAVSKLSLIYADGLPLELTSSLLPKRSYFTGGIASHIHIHSKIKPTQSRKSKNQLKAVLSKTQLLHIVEHLMDTVKGLNLKPGKSPWSSYVTENTYTEKTGSQKAALISDWLRDVNPGTTWDIGCNTGSYSLLASAHSKSVIAMDSDHRSIEQLYTSIRNSNHETILPLVIDWANPSHGTGWDNLERKTLMQRGKPDLILALALVHHLRITAGVPFDMMAKSFSEKGAWLIIEYIPRDDIQVMEMLMHRQDVFGDFSIDSFTSIFEKYFVIKQKTALSGSGRILFLMQKRAE